MVALAAVGTWWVTSGAGEGPKATYLVASRAIGPGEHLEARDLRLATVDLPAGLRGAAFADAEAVVGAVTLGPIGAGELVQSAGIEPAGSEAAGQQVSFSVESDWAVAGSLRLGDRIDVYATIGDGAGATTTRVLADTTVQRLDATGGDGLGESRGQSVTVTVVGTERAATLVNAARTATITVVRVTGSPTAEAPASTSTTAASKTTTTRRAGR
ncbi:hypothetical protein BH10ACT1_BH10ACT1_00530 [soil metagenome]